MQYTGTVHHLITEKLSPLLDLQKVRMFDRWTLLGLSNNWFSCLHESCKQDGGFPINQSRAPHLLLKWANARQSYSFCRALLVGRAPGHHPPPSPIPITILSFRSSPSLTSCDVGVTFMYYFQENSMFTFDILLIISWVLVNTYPVSPYFKFSFLRSTVLKLRR